MSVLTAFIVTKTQKQFAGSCRTSCIALFSNSCVTVLIALFTLLASMKVSAARCYEETSVPDFSSLSVKERKSAFIETFIPLVNSENTHILRQRKKLKKLSRIKQLHRHDLKWLKKLGMVYRYPFDHRPSSLWFKEMLSRVDMLPPSLVLVQAANESAWGTSRFAREGNNYFGMWCYSAGCGIIPEKRTSGLFHEVRKFCSINESLTAYFQNINTNSAYQVLRNIRTRERHDKKIPDSLVLLQGLEKYSERGKAYIASLSQWIIKDNLRRFDLPKSNDMSRNVKN